MKSFITILVFTLALAAGNVDVLAQLTALPVSISPKEEPELTTVVVHGDFGFYNHNIGDFKSVGGRLVWNPGSFSIMGGAAFLNADKDQLENGFTVGTALGYDIQSGTSQISKPIIQIKGGIGYTKIDEFKQWNFPLALGVSFIFPAPKFNAKPWGSPRLHIRISDEPDDGNSTDLGVGISAGLTITLPSESGIHLGVDWLKISGHSEFVVAIGLHWDHAIF